MSVIHIEDVYYLRQNNMIIQGSINNHTWCDLIYPITFTSDMPSIIELTSNMILEKVNVYFILDNQIILKLNDYQMTFIY